MDNQPNELKLKALEASVYYPPYEEDTAIESITLQDEFNLEEIKNNIKSSVKILSYNVAHKPSIIEILDILNQYKHQFIIEQQKCISFYWSGILVYRIELNKQKATSHGKQLHISLQKYKSMKDELNTAKNDQWMFKLLLAGSFILWMATVGITFYGKRKYS